MGQVYSKNISISPSRCCFTGKLGYSGCAAYFMDIATEHAEIQNIGLSRISKENRFWIAVRTRMEFLCMPGMSEEVVLSTWTEPSKGVKFIRDYEIAGKNGAMVKGRTQWAVVDTVSGKPVPVSEVLPDDYEFHVPGSACDGFSIIPNEFDDVPFLEYTVKSTDIDLGGHMNNVAYIRALESLFTTEKISEYDMLSFEIHYKKPCYEGDRLKFYMRKDSSNTLLFKASTEACDTAFYRLEYR